MIDMSVFYHELMAKLDSLADLPPIQPTLILDASSRGMT
jgi:hypothetical protein